MIIIIDAYNVLKYIFGNKFITEKQRNQFIDYLARYGKKKGHELFIVFDGGPFGMAETFVQKPVTVMYTGPERADDVVIRLVTKYQRYDTLLVSTDREITGHAEHAHMPYIDSHLFYTCMQRALGALDGHATKAVHGVRKMHPEPRGAFDAFMESLEVPKNLAKTKEAVSASELSGKKLSKNDRYIMTIVDKL
jgi:hypothetical protein